ncbi:tail tubular protein B [Aeromonas phage JELG-KS1]|uniref:Tail tubular protein B n=1 Tax=Aeromonas phage JELG-KS1 TaxID=2951233 RepID=A0A9E7SYX2_9CAUD|nr:tail tubular protein B [Aeromonas phage JELG-KS1]
MSLISQSIKNLKGGISQQPDILRYDDQGAEQINAFSSEVEGLQKRPPSVSVSRLGKYNDLGAKPLCHTIHRDDDEQYYVFFTGTTICVVDLKDGTIQPVKMVNGSEYIQTSNPRDDIRCVTVADYTFVINRNREVRKGTSKTPQYRDPNKNAIVVCSGGQYARTFNIWINDILAATYTTPDGREPNQGHMCDIQYILTALRDSFRTVNEFSGWGYTVAEGYAWIEAPASGTINSIKVTDGYNGKLLTGFRNDVQKTSELPVYAPDNYQVRVSGEVGTDQDDYWVRFDAERNVWVETAAPNILSDYDNSTMPHALIREADGTFTFKRLDWSHRACGDDDTNPYPSFIDQTITDVFFFRNRLGFLSGENVILSESGAYFNFFPPSVAVTADSDPIDVAVSTNKISILKYAIPFSEELLLWADNNQFVLGSDGILTPTSVKLDLTTEFEVSDKARPYSLGRGVYFVSPRSNFSSIRRYYAVQDVTSVKNAEDISAHIPSYIPNGVFSMAGSATENFVTVLTEGAPSKVFVYKFLYVQEDLLQQSWSHWDFGDGVAVLGCSMIGAVMHLVLDTPSGLFLERITFTQNTKDYPNEPYRLYMDRKTQYTLPADSYDDDDYKTTMYLKDIYGATPKTGRYYAVLENGTTFFFDPPAEGWESIGGIIQFDGDLSNTIVFVGEAYTMKYKFSRFLIKSTASDGSVNTEDIGRLQLRRAWVNYEMSGNFVVEVSNQGRKSFYQMTGNRLGSQELVIGRSNLDTGQFRYPVGGNAQNIEVTLYSDTPNPVSIIGGGWEGNYVRRSRGI